MGLVRIPNGALSAELFRELLKAQAEESLEVEALDDGSLLLRMTCGTEITAHLIEETIRARQSRAKEAVFDAIEAEFGSEIASRLCTVPAFEALLHSSEAITASAALRLIAAAERLASGATIDEDLVRPETRTLNPKDKTGPSGARPFLRIV